MINIIQPQEAEKEDEPKLTIEEGEQDLVLPMEQIENLLLTPTARYLKEISITLKDILREMRKRKI